MPDNESAGSVWRRTVFAEGASPSVSAIEEALVRQKDLIDALAQFDAELKLAVQGSADKAAKKPDL